MARRETLAFLHTAELHVESFGVLARQLDDSVPVRHEVRADLLTTVLAAGASSEARRVAVCEVLDELARDGATVRRSLSAPVRPSVAWLRQR